MGKDARDTADWVMRVVDEADNGEFLSTATRLELKAFATNLAEVGNGRRRILLNVLERTFTDGETGFVNR